METPLQSMQFMVLCST